MTMAISRGVFVVGPASPASPHVRIYTLVHLSQASPRGNYHPTLYLRLGHAPLPLASVTRTLNFAHDHRVSPRRCTPLRIWLDIRLHLPRSAAGLLDPSRVLGVRFDVGLLDIIYQ